MSTYGDNKTNNHPSEDRLLLKTATVSPPRTPLYCCQISITFLTYLNLISYNGSFSELAVHKQCEVFVCGVY